jgi:hypothetical protein
VPLTKHVSGHSQPKQGYLEDIKKNFAQTHLTAQGTIPLIQKAKHVLSFVKESKKGTTLNVISFMMIGKVEMGDFVHVSREGTVALAQLFTIFICKDTETQAF